MIQNTGRQTYTEADVQAINDLIKKWAPKVTTKLKSSARWFEGKDKPFVIRGKQRETKLHQSISSTTKMDYGMVELVSFKFERHGVFVHKGVGRGYPISGGGKIMNSIGKRRVAVEWFNPIIDKQAPLLADQLANINADIAVNATRMRIK